MRYEFITQHASDWPITVLCETRGVSAAGYYSWQVRAPNPQQQRRDARRVEIRSAHAESKARYAARGSTPGWKRKGTTAA